MGTGWDPSSRGLPAGPALLKVLGWGPFGGGAGPPSNWAKPSGNCSSPLTRCTSRTEGGSVAAPAGRRRHCSAEGGHPEGRGGTGAPEGGAQAFLACQGVPLRLISAPAPPRGQQRGPIRLGQVPAHLVAGSPPTPADKCPVGAVEVGTELGFRAGDQRGCGELQGLTPRPALWGAWGVRGWGSGDPLCPSTLPAFRHRVFW